MPIPEPYLVTREFTGEFNGQAVGYRTLAGETYIRDDRGTPVASFFTVAYLRSDIEDPSTRPVTLVFNGGPGSSAQWLHMGVFGPKRVVVPADPVNIGAPPYPLADNNLSPLDVTDLVFVDPIGTGFSRALGGRDQKLYWGLNEDARSIADFIQAWITEHYRWNSPKYIIGESYGTTRACLLADLLCQRFIALNGLVLIAPVLDYQNSRPRAGDGAILPYASFLPAFAAAAWYHGKIEPNGRTLEVFLDEVRLFARTEYVQALVANDYRLSETDKTQIASRLAAFTGLKQSYILQSKLRVPIERFRKELLRDQGLVIGRLDSRYTAVESQSVAELPESDATTDAIAAAVTSAMHEQLKTLGIQIDRPYVPLTEFPSWNWMLDEKALNGGGFINVIPHLGRTMRQNNDLRVFVALGYFDLATPFYGAENALSQDGLVYERIAYAHYEVGHLMFLSEPSRVSLLNRIKDFVAFGSRDSAHQGTQV
jgi:carboxypeptidase C (cathepsin A)